MKLSAKGEYAYRAVFELAEFYLQSADAVVQLERIATLQSIPKKYLVQILLQLKRSGLVGTLRGVKGGYFLRKPPSQITLGEVLELIDGPFVPVNRAMNENEPPEDPLTRVVQPIFDEVRNAIRTILYGITFEEICRRTRQPRDQMYYI